MKTEEFGQHYHHIIFKNACYERTGQAFQRLFERIMQKHDPSFIAVKPSGMEGDWKCDGFSQTTGTVFQCYSPERMTQSKAAAKVSEDFDGAKKYWNNVMKAWVFVWSAHEALPPQVLNVLQKVRKENVDISIDDWDRERLWDIVKALSEPVRTELLGAIPEVTRASDTDTTAEIKTLLTFLSARQLKHDITDLNLTGILEKLERNKLSNSVRALVTPAIPVARLVQYYLTRHPDSDFSTRISQALKEKYSEVLAAGVADPDQVFWQIVLYSMSGDFSNPKRFWPALGIVSYYFELCDIFER